MSTQEHIFSEENKNKNKREQKGRHSPWLHSYHRDITSLSFSPNNCVPQTPEDNWDLHLHLHCTIEDNGSYIFYRPRLHPIGFGLLQCQSCIQTSSQQQSQNVSYCPHSIYQWTYFDQRYQLHSFAKHCSILAPLPSTFAKLNSFSTLILFSIGVA